MPRHPFENNGGPNKGEFITLPALEEGLQYEVNHLPDGRLTILVVESAKTRNEDVLKKRELLEDSHPTGVFNMDEYLKNRYHS